MVQITLNLSSNVIGDFDDEVNFPHKLLLTNIQASRILKAFANASLTNKNFLKAQVSKRGIRRIFR